MKRYLLRLAILAALLVLALGGCSLLGVSIEARVVLFLNDLNSTDRSMIYLNFHPDLTGDYDEIQNETYPDWDLLFPTMNITYDIPDLITSDAWNVTGNIDSIYGAWAGPKPIVFRMAQDGADWMIPELDFNGSNLIN